MMKTDATDYLRERPTWEGGIDALCDEAVHFLSRYPHFDPDWSPTARLVRSYATQRIISLPERVGRDARYRYSHLIELLSARALIAGGLRLEKVQETLGGTTQEERLAIIERRLLDVAAIRTEIASPFPVDEATADSVLASPADRTRVLAEVMQRLDPDAGRRRPLLKTMARLSVTRWCHLLIGREELKRLNPQQARDIGFAVAAALMDPDIRRRAGSGPFEED